MSRLSKVEIERRALRKVRVDKAKDSLMKAFAALMDRHLPALVQEGIEVTGNMEILVSDGTASLRLRYSTEIKDSARVTLDDGQEDLQLGDGEDEDEEKAPAPAAASTLPAGASATGGAQ